MANILCREWWTVFSLPDSPNFHFQKGIYVCYAQCVCCNMFLKTERLFLKFVDGNNLLPTIVFKHPVWTSVCSIAHCMQNFHNREIVNLCDDDGLKFYCKQSLRRTWSHLVITGCLPQSSKSNEQWNWVAFHSILYPAILLCHHAV